MRGKRVTIFVGESDRWHHRPLYLAILEHLKAAGCAGATVTRGTAGFGAHSQIKTATILRLSVDLPVVITAVDTPERIDHMLPEISTMLSGGLVIVDETEVYFHSAAFRGGLPDVSVGDIMTKDPEAVGPDTPIAEVVERLAGRDYTALPVVDQARRVVGVISDSDMLGRGLTRLSVSLHKVIGPDLVHEYVTRLKSEGRTVREAMTAPAITVTATTSIKDAAHLMHLRTLKRLPVVDNDGVLVGILGRLDIFQSITAGYARRTVPREIRLPQEHGTVGQVMERDIVAVPATAPLADVVGKLLAANVKRVLVVDDSGRLTGIITDSDIVARVDPEERPGLVTLLRSRWSNTAHRQVQRAYGQRAADVMTSPAVAIADTTTVIEALTLTVERHVKRLPVIDSQGRPVGIVSRTALLASSLDLAAAPERA
jgi:CBS domain-containing protein/PII-like signaling protein